NMRRFIQLEGRRPQLLERRSPAEPVEQRKPPPQPGGEKNGPITARTSTTSSIERSSGGGKAEISDYSSCPSPFFSSLRVSSSRCSAVNPLLAVASRPVQPLLDA